MNRRGLPERRIFGSTMARYSHLADCEYRGLVVPGQTSTD